MPLNSDPITVGFAVTLQFANRRQLTAATIKTIGRKWVTLATGGREYRFARPTAPYPALIPLDGDGHSPGNVLLDPAKVESDHQRDEAWRNLMDALRRCPRPPESVSLEAIAAARKALGL